MIGIKKIENLIDGLERCSSCNIEDDLVEIKVANEKIYSSETLVLCENCKRDLRDTLLQF